MYRSQFVGNIGGQLGLCIGISLLSLVELLEIISELCVLFYYKKIAKKKRPQREHKFSNPFYGIQSQPEIFAFYDIILMPHQKVKIPH